MFTRQEASALKEKFWTSFGQYLLPMPSASGAKLNWINYKTGVKYIRFVMDADREHAFVQIEITHPDTAMRNRFYQLFESLKFDLEAETQAVWNWNQSVEKEGKIISTINISLEDVNILNVQHWPAIISFFKPLITGLDRFWYNQKEIFEMLA
jgi:hypothetical protein